MDLSLGDAVAGIMVVMWNGNGNVHVQENEIWKLPALRNLESILLYHLMILVVINCRFQDWYYWLTDSVEIHGLQMNLAWCLVRCTFFSWGIQAVQSHYRQYR